MIGIASKSVARFARDIAVRVEGGDISTFIVATDEAVPSVAEEVASTLEQFLRGPKVTVVAAPTARALLDVDTDSNVIVVVGIQGWQLLEWRHLDLHRARLAGRALVMVMSEASASMLVAEAPHLYSFVAEPVREGHDEGLLSDSERRQRIDTLEASKGFKSSELILRVEAGESLADPEFGEWLILLGRGDLL